MDTSTVDDMLLNSFEMSDLNNIDIEKFQKGIFSPSPKSEILPTSPGPQRVTSPQKPLSPHVVPHFQQPPHGYQHPPLRPPPQGLHMPNQANQHPHVHHRKIQLGPNFDRLGILNQANEIPPMTAPFFAKALQQHGGTTLGAILQAHQHALQQQMHRENFLLQQAAHHHMFQTVPIHNMYHQQRIQAMMMERRGDDQIVPNPQILPPTESWFKHGNHHHMRKIKQEEEYDESVSGRTSEGSMKDHKRSPERYLIFNDEHHETENMSDEEEDKSNLPIAPPKNSVFVRYQPESNRCLPSFSEAFSGHIDKLKLKEENLKEMLMRHQEIHNQQILLRKQADGIARQQVPPPSDNDICMEDDTKVKNMMGHAQSPEKIEHKSSGSAEETTVTETVVSTSRETDNKAISPSHVDFLNDVSKDTKELFSYYENTKDNASRCSEQPDSPVTSIHSQSELLSDEANVAKATDSISIFHGELDLNSEHSYDNLFNGNSDEHYFQAFKENNLHLLNDLNQQKPETNEDILKLLHSPLDFLNEKFLN